MVSLGHICSNKFHFHIVIGLIKSDISSFSLNVSHLVLFCHICDHFVSVPTKDHLANLIYAKSCNKYVTYRVTSVEGQHCLITTTKLVFQDRDGGYLFKLYCYMCVIEVVTVVVFKNFPRRIFSLTQNSHHHAKTCFKRVVLLSKTG